MKKNRGYLIFASISVVTFALLFLLFIPDSSNTSMKVTIEIEKGESVAEISVKLKNEGVIKNKDLFTMLAKVGGIEKKLKSGKYLLSKNMNEYDALIKIYKGKVLLKRLIVPEGFTIYQIAGRIRSLTGIDSLEFLKACRDREMLKRYGIRGKNCEGFLFPETYFLSDNMNAYEIIEMMLDRFNDEYPDSVFKPNKYLFDRYDYVILASMIEKEAMADYEKPVIAGVYYNRIGKGMLLQCCATVFYAQGRVGGKLLYRDLEFESPYNTYKHIGLPPGPISNPGESSIDAVLNPVKTDYMFYVSNGDGTHTFSKTYNQHIKAQKER